MTDEKELLGDSMDMFSHGNDTLNRTQETAPEPTREEAAPDTPIADRARDDQGRFAPKEAVNPTLAPAATIPPVIADADPEKQPVSKAEFKGMLDERDKRQKAEARAAELERRVQQFESQQQQTQIPSLQDNPEAFAQYIQQQRTSLAFDMSETMAREKHGDEPVTKAMDWALQRAQQSPAFAAEYLKQKHPIDWAVKQQKRDATLNDIGDDPDAYVRRRAAELGLMGQATPQPQAAQPSLAASPQPASPQPQTPAPTRSIANAISAGGASVIPPSGEFAAIDGMFNR